jgi:catechol 2,3-dioxygenase-like lactoylglutathione lyase family enzyme
MEPTFKGVDCFMVKVGNLEEGINFYVNKLGHKLELEDSNFGRASHGRIYVGTCSPY